MKVKIGTHNLTVTLEEVLGCNKPINGLYRYIIS